MKVINFIIAFLIMLCLAFAIGSNIKSCRYEIDAENCNQDCQAQGYDFGWMRSKWYCQCEGFEPKKNRLDRP